MSATIPKDLRDKVALESLFRCGYCLTAEFIIGTELPMDHLTPQARGGMTVQDNLWLSCTLCNRRKSDKLCAKDQETGKFLPLFNPRRQRWNDHFTWSSEGDRIIGLTPIGRATVDLLQLNRPPLVGSRRRWVEAGWHPPKDSI